MILLLGPSDHLSGPAISERMPQSPGEEGHILHLVHPKREQVPVDEIHRKPRGTASLDDLLQGQAAAETPRVYKPSLRIPTLGRIFSLGEGVRPLRILPGKADAEEAEKRGQHGPVQDLGLSR